MALFKPEITTSKGGFLGIKEMGIVQFKDRGGEYDWADIYLSVEVAIPNSKYTNTLDIKGSLDKAPNGDISGGTVLTRLYRLFESIGCSAGINLQGKWETDDGEIIPDIASYLNERFAEGGFPDLTEAPMNYVGYIYKSQNLKTRKVYTEVYPRLFPNTDKGKQEMASLVTWLKQKGRIKEYVAPPTAEGTSTLNEASLSNL